jgi:hypothetical protein
MSAATAKRLATFIYMGPQPASASAPAMGAPAFELRFRNGYAAGIIGDVTLGRWLSYGVYLGRFERGVWYRVPPATARDLRKLTRGLAPLRVTPEALAKSR